MQKGLRQMWRSWQIEYYTPAIMMALALAVIILFPIGKKKFKGVWLLYVHALTSFLQTAIFYSISFIFKADITIYATYSSPTFVIIETGCFFYFIRPYIKARQQRHITTLLFNLFIITATGYIAFGSDNRFYLMIVMLAECLLLLTGCCIYYFNLLQKATQVNLLRIDHFWVVSAFLLLICIITPAAVIDYIYFDQIKNFTMGILHALMYTSYSALFAVYLIVYMCTPKNKSDSLN